MGFWLRSIEAVGTRINLIWLFYSGVNSNSMGLICLKQAKAAALV
jgi:hypothetical protein